MTNLKQQVYGDNKFIHLSSRVTPDQWQNVNEHTWAKMNIPAMVHVAIQYTVAGQ